MTVTGYTHTHITMIPGTMIHGTTIPGIMIHGITAIITMLRITTVHTTTGLTQPLTAGLPATCPTAGSITEDGTGT